MEVIHEMGCDKKVCVCITGKNESGLINLIYTWCYLVVYN